MRRGAAYNVLGDFSPPCRRDGYPGMICMSKWHAEKVPENPTRYNEIVRPAT